MINTPYPPIANQRISLDRAREETSALRALRILPGYGMTAEYTPNGTRIAISGELAYARRLLTYGRWWAIKSFKEGTLTLEHCSYMRGPLVVHLGSLSKTFSKKGEIQLMAKISSESGTATLETMEEAEEEGFDAGKLPGDEYYRLPLYTITGVADAEGDLSFSVTEDLRFLPQLVAYV